jgi:ABC-type Na+ transport system ATPase subunit NatA
MKNSLIVLALLCAVLEVLALIQIQQTSAALKNGGDIVTFASDDIPVNVGDQVVKLKKGTYVVTPSGFELLERYWVYKYWYFTASLPLIAALILFAWYFAARKSAIR